MSIAEIAKCAGVSIATVSRVLNNSPGVRPQTIQQVREALQSVPYNHSAMRRGPRLGKRAARRTGNIGIFILGETRETWFKFPFFSGVVSGVTRAVTERGQHAVIEEILDSVEMSPAIRKGEIDGALVFVSSAADPKMFESLQARVPVVRIMGEELPAAATDQVGSDNLAIGRAAYEYLAAAGCKNIAYVTTRADHQIFLLRAIGMLITAERMGHPAPTAMVAGIPRFGGMAGLPLKQCESLQSLADCLAEMNPRPDGLFISQDVETIGLYPMLAHHGIRPGRDITIVSCNNEQSALAMLSPRPASIDLNADQIGRLAVGRLMNRIARPHEASLRLLVAPKLIAPPATVASQV